MKNNLIIILATLIGWLFFKYLLLGIVPFEQSFKYGFMFHGTALMTYAFISAYHGIRTIKPTPDFIDGFKHIAKTVVGYAVGATVVVGIWHHVIRQEATHDRYISALETISTTFSSEEEYLHQINESNLPKDASLSEWIISQQEVVKIFYSAQTQISLTLMVYLVVGIFISFVASLLWTKVWIMPQQIPEKSR